MKPPYKIILEPVVSEKGTDLTQKENKVLFKVDRYSNKSEIRWAVEELYPAVKVCEVNTISVKGKPKRVRTQLGRTSHWKKALIKLREGDKIEFAS
ncbi:MAG: 50S ribosomal protein L23 [Chlamydiae bacterium]|nr:50S ribosomal protein L23 [Chlamydiota bacterium]MBI3266283.1 50S ribosomal protein L23 [Chlamydiota bacterium]